VPVTEISFGAFTLNLETRQLLSEGREVHLTPKAYELLSALIVDRPKVLSKAMLQEHLWPDTTVIEANLANLIAEVRAALGDQARAPVFIRTAHGYGYAFCGDAAVVSAEKTAVADRTRCWLEWGRLRFPLPDGAHVVGRDADVDVQLDAATVSRRHARIVVSDKGTLLEDLDSKNGTFRGNERVTAPVALSNGDAIRIGSLQVTFYVRSSDTATETL
jgi:DNA-binding winged helix-turn-helix (wHTH) protein